MIKFISFYLCFLISVFIHELGHYFWAEKFGVRVDSFTIGVGYTYFKRKLGNTDFSLNLVPLMGFVSHNEEDINKLSIGKNLIIIMAGVFNNFMIAILGLIFVSKFNIAKVFNFIISLFYSLFSALNIKSFSNISNYISPDNSLQGVYTQISISGFKEALMLFAVLNLCLCLGNLIPIPVLDGGQAILLLLQRFLLKFGISKKAFDKVSNPICWASFILITIMSMINETLAYVKMTDRKTLVYILYIIIGALIGALIVVVKQTDFYKKSIRNQ